MFYNVVKTAFLLAALSGLLLFLGGMFGGRSGIQMALIMALIINFFMYFFSDKIVLNMYKAKPLDKQSFSNIYHMVEELSNKMNIPMPKLWLVTNPMANAFATGRNPGHASVALTTGIMKLLEPDELRGVLAHELSHIKNRDILVGTIAATLATAIGYLANMMRYATFWAGSTSRNNRNQQSNPIFMLVVALLMPIAATVIQLALSRSREYLADDTGAHVSHEPLALASALEKLHTHLRYAHLKEKNNIVKTSTASLFIVYPFIKNGWTTWFSTHPPMEKRIERLKNMAGKW